MLPDSPLQDARLLRCPSKLGVKSVRAGSSGDLRQVRREANSARRVSGGRSKGPCLHDWGSGKTEAGMSFEQSAWLTVCLHVHHVHVIHLYTNLFSVASLLIICFSCFVAQVYVLNRDSAANLTISSPLEAHKSHNIVFDITGLDCGFDNPIFAAIELDYSEADLVTPASIRCFNHAVRSAVSVDQRNMS